MRSVARYIIVLDRLDPENDYAASEVGEGGHDGTAVEACNQVANELQEAMDRIGQPAGFFNVIDRRKVSPTERIAATEAPEDLARQVGLERRMEDD